MFKKSILIVLIVLMIGLIPVYSQEEEEDNTKIVFRYELASENTIYGIVFPLGNYLFNSLDYGFSSKLFGGEISAFLQTAVSKSSFAPLIGLIGPIDDSFDEKCYLGGIKAEYLFASESLELRTIAHFLSWQFPEKNERKENSDWGMLIGEEITFRTLLTFGYLHFWADVNNEFTGDYFFVKLNEELLGINWEARIGYNKKFLVEKEGLSNMFGGRKKINLGKDFFAELFLHFFWNDPDVSENRIAGGFSLSKVF